MAKRTKYTKQIFEKKTSSNTGKKKIKIIEPVALNPTRTKIKYTTRKYKYSFRKEKTVKSICSLIPCIAWYKYPYHCSEIPCELIKSSIGISPN
jgi:hypothetical protein